MFEAQGMTMSCRWGGAEALSESYFYPGKQRREAKEEEGKEALHLASSLADGYQALAIAVCKVFMETTYRVQRAPPALCRCLVTHQEWKSNRTKHRLTVWADILSLL